MGKKIKPEDKWPKLESYLVPLFQSSWVYLCTSREDWLQAHRNLKAEPNNVNKIAGCVRHFHDGITGENMYLVGVFDGKVSTLVHECAHACFYVCNDVGVRVDTAERNETYCYMIERMVDRFMPHVKPLEKKNEKANR